MINLEIIILSEVSQKDKYMIRLICGILKNYSNELIYKTIGNKLCCCSVAQSCLTFCDPMDCSTPGLQVHHQLLPELAQICVHQVGDAIQPSHPLLSPSPPAFNLSQHQGLF